MPTPTLERHPTPAMNTPTTRRHGVRLLIAIHAAYTITLATLAAWTGNWSYPAVIAAFLVAAVPIHLLGLRRHDELHHTHGRVAAVGWAIPAALLALTVTGIT